MPKGLLLMKQELLVYINWKFLDKKIKLLDNKIKFLDNKIKFLDNKIKFFEVFMIFMRIIVKFINLGPDDIGKKFKKSENSENL